MVFGDYPIDLLRSPPGHKYACLPGLAPIPFAYSLREVQLASAVKLEAAAAPPPSTPAAVGNRGVHFVKPYSRIGFANSSAGKS
jgi:hypothetical protein